MICGHYEKSWARLRRRADSPIKSKENCTYRSIEAWVKSERSRRGSGRCVCGCGDQWSCVNRRCVLGQSRIGWRLRLHLKRAELAHHSNSTVVVTTRQGVAVSAPATLFSTSILTYISPSPGLYST